MKQIFTDGSCSNNGYENSVGGFAAVIMSSPTNIEALFCKHDIENTTNNRMELEGMIAALQYCFCHNLENFIIYSDSAYVVNIINDWMWKWYNNGWTRPKNQPIENLDLIQKIFTLYNRFEIINFKIEKVSGHSGVAGNELADAYATNNNQKLEEIFLKYDIS